MAQTRFAGALLGCVLSAPAPSSAQPGSASLAERPVRPYTLRLSPNAIQDPHIPLRIDLDGPTGERMEVLILPGCGSRTQPSEPPGRGVCKSPLGPVWEVLLDSQHGHGSLEIAMDGSDGQPALPVDVPLWLRVRSTSKGGGHRQARFSITKDSCSIWKSLLDQFGGGRCVLGLNAVFEPTRSRGSGRPPAMLEVRRLDPRRPESKPQPVPGTQGATGAAWDGPNAILVTLGARSAEPGLYRIDLATLVRTRLYKPIRDTELAAPLALPGSHDRSSAVIEEREDGSTLLVMRGGKVQRRIPLGASVHQLLRTDPSGHEVLGVRRGLTGVELFTVALTSGVETTGGDAPLLLAFTRAASDGLGVLEYEDVATPDGWDLLLLDKDAKPLRELLVGRGHDLLPSWRNDGGELLYLGQIDDKRKTQP